MSAPTIGAPIGPDIPHSARRVVYDHIPRLHELLENGGWPGVVYAQACVHNVKLAADRDEKPANLRPIRGATYYSIQGPKGMADMALVGCGGPIQGASPEAGARLFFTDGEVEELTGLSVKYKIWFRGEPDARRTSQVKVTSDADEGLEGDGRVQDGQPAQRVKNRTRGEKAEAGDRHRPVRKPKKNLAGHTHPANFGRYHTGCPRCAELQYAQKGP